MEPAASAIYDIQHGGGLAILIPNWMDYCVNIYWDFCSIDKAAYVHSK